ncbi:DUF2920 family protein [Campylobacter lari]|nr:DUF2920 family protein [Campylobacter lari]
MLKNQTYFIDSCNDVELNIKRESKLEYRITYDDSKQMKAIVFIIGGYGANANIHFLESYRNFIAKKFDVVAVNVFYHCFCQRISDIEKYSAKVIICEDDLRFLKRTLEYLGLSTFGLSVETANEFVDKLDKHIQMLKDMGKREQEYKAKIASTFIPPNNEYNNFAIMPAIDHINALKDIMKNYPQFKSLPKIYGGGSYGGLVALMCAKIAPWYVDGVIDNSGAALPPLNYILGRELGQSEFIFEDNNILNSPFIKTYWTRKDPNSPYYFADENYLIRTLANPSHLTLQSQKNKNIIYISYHSAKDDLTSAEYKISMIEILKALNYEVDFHLIDEKDIDGKFIKDLTHGCGIPDKTLFNKELPIMLEKLKDKTFSIKEDSISYPCKNKVFTFKDKNDKFVLEIV